MQVTYFLLLMVFFPSFSQCKGGLVPQSVYFSPPLPHLVGTVIHARLVLMSLPCIHIECTDFLCYDTPNKR